MKTYHIYKLNLKQDSISKEKNVKLARDESGAVRIVKIGLVEYVYDLQNDEWIPVEEIFTKERRTK